MTELVQGKSWLQGSVFFFNGLLGMLLMFSALIAGPLGFALNWLGFPNAAAVVWFAMIFGLILACIFKKRIFGR